jgi:magnesium chelatase subunit H
MNDSAAASQFLRDLNLPYRSAVSLDTQTIEAWSDSATGLNPVQAGMQIAIPEIDGATEPFIYGGIPSRGQEPIALEDRGTRLARRLKRWHNLQTAPREARHHPFLFSTEQRKHRHSRGSRRVSRCLGFIEATKRRRLPS